MVGFIDEEETLDSGKDSRSPTQALLSTHTAPSKESRSEGEGVLVATAQLEAFHTVGL